MRDHSRKVLLSCFGALGLVLACSPNTAPPSPLAVDQIPAEMQRVFAKAKPELRQIVDKMVEALKSKDFPTAFEGMHYLTTVRDATKEQQLVTARSMLTVNALLQTASAQGDQKAAALLEYQKRSK